jgi:hypothetical protein
MAKPNKADLQFKIDQLRKAKITCGIESAAVTLMVTLLVSSLGFLGFMFPIINQHAKLVLQVLLGSAVLVFLGMIAVNIRRCFQIKQLEKQL